jgi:4-amino-4-deoxy-L-arabinose transferase-like glycosyltransferase
VLLAWCGVLFFYGLNGGDLHRTEGLRAILGAEMLRDGNWVVPTLYGEPLLTKPPGMYAAIALSSWPWGQVTPWSARLPSALAATLTVLFFYFTFARCLGRLAGIVAAAVLPASLMWLERVPSAEIDLLQLAWVTAAVLCFLRALESAESERRCAWREWGWWQAALLCVAGGVLTKWTSPAFFYLTVVPLLAWRRRLQLLLSLPHLLSALAAMLLCAAWAVAAVSAVGWDLFYNTISREMLLRLSPMHHPRPYPWGELLEFPLLLLGGNLPWSLFALLTLAPGFGRLWDARGRRLLQLLHCWTWANLLFWTIVPGHRPRHALPLQPGLTGLAAFVWTAWLTGRWRWPVPRLRPLPTLGALLAVWLSIKVAYAQVILPNRAGDNSARGFGETLAAKIPPDEMLYLCRMKDEGGMFYYGRPVKRLLDWRGLTGPAYCVLIEDEWRCWPSDRPARLLERLHDEQGKPIVLIHVGVE